MKEIKHPKKKKNGATYCVWNTQHNKHVNSPQIDAHIQCSSYQSKTFCR